MNPTWKTSQGSLASWPLEHSQFDVDNDFWGDSDGSAQDSFDTSEIAFARVEVRCPSEGRAVPFYRFMSAREEFDSHASEGSQNSSGSPLPSEKPAMRFRRFESALEDLESHASMGVQSCPGSPLSPEAPAKISYIRFESAVEDLGCLGSARSQNSSVSLLPEETAVQVPLVNQPAAAGRGLLLNIAQGVAGFIKKTTLQISAAFSAIAAAATTSVRAIISFPMQIAKGVAGFAQTIIHGFLSTCDAIAAAAKRNVHVILVTGLSSLFFALVGLGLKLAWPWLSTSVSYVRSSAVLQNTHS